MNLHPKVKAALVAAVGVIAAAIGAYLNGTVDGEGAVALVVSGLVPVIAGYLKSAPEAPPAQVDAAAATDA